MSDEVVDQLWAQLATDAQDLVPCVAQDVRTRAVLMVAWVSKEALGRSIQTGYATYYSRSRQAIWQKGAISGHRQRIVHIRLDNDHDTLLYLVDAQLPAGNDGSDTYFNFRRQGGAWVWDPIRLLADLSDDEHAATEAVHILSDDVVLRVQAARLLDSRDPADTLELATDLVETLLRTLKRRGLNLRTVLENLERRIKR